MPSSRGSSWPRDWTQVSRVCCTADRFFTFEQPGKPVSLLDGVKCLFLLPFVDCTWLSSPAGLSDSNPHLGFKGCKWQRCPGQGVSEVVLYITWYLKMLKPYQYVFWNILYQNVQVNCFTVKRSSCVKLNMVYFCSEVEDIAYWIMPKSF